MSSIVLDLQQEILKHDCDILNALRKAHLIASKLKLHEFDRWVIHELNGYADVTESDVPEYRKVSGQLKAWNPYRGWIPAQLTDEEIENIVCHRVLWQSIGELQQLYDESKGAYFLIEFSAGQMENIASLFHTPFPMQYALHISKHILPTITEKVKNCLLEWTIKLENEGILGEGMRFSQEETDMAQKVAQTVNHYYGTVVNGDVKQSQVVSGDHNTISFNYGQVNDLILKVKEAIADELPFGEDRETADELISEVETKISNKAKPGLIRATLSGLRDFLVGSGATVAGGLILQYLQQTL